MSLFIILRCLAFACYVLQVLFFPLVIFLAIPSVGKHLGSNGNITTFPQHWIL